MIIRGIIHREYRGPFRRLECALSIRMYGGGFVTTDLPPLNRLLREAFPPRPSTLPPGL